ncbi:MAG TPA: enoyl-CoA hydratase/isomerase family protein, partial [Deltaproteobacteria bacterium]|nr:enoyl-CoA hydratase/isomerase family protein [Deltaproteobacteria bacterium]
PSMLLTVKKAMPYHKYEELIFSGKRVGAKELEESHVIVKACADADALMKEAVDFAKTFQKGRAIFGENKKRMHKHIIEAMEKEDPEYIDALKLMV